MFPGAVVVRDVAAGLVTTDRGLERGAGKEAE